MAKKNTATTGASRNSPAITLAFDVGSHAIGWSVLKGQESKTELLGCGTVLFEKDGVLLRERRFNRTNRRRMRSTRYRIHRLGLVLTQLGVLKAEEIAAASHAGTGHAAPWFASARVLASKGQHVLKWSELWHVLRWYCHNRGYQPHDTHNNKQEENLARCQRTREAMEKFGTTSMAETICRWLQIDPLSDKRATTRNYKGRDVAFERKLVREEVRRLLNFHLGKLPGLTQEVITLLVDDARAYPVEGVLLARRYRGGLLTGRLGTRYNNRVIPVCPLTGSKLAGRDHREYHRFRWAMLLTKIGVSTEETGPLRPLTASERQTITKEVEGPGFLLPLDFRRRVRVIAKSTRDNLDQIFVNLREANSVVLDPAKRLTHTNAQIRAIWPHLTEELRRHTLNNWWRHRAITLSSLRDQLVKAGHDPAAFDTALAESFNQAKRRGRPANNRPTNVTQALSVKLSIDRAGGRAPFTRELMIKAYAEVMAGQNPTEPGGCLHGAKDANLAGTASLDNQTNNHFTRHRLRIFNRLVHQLIADPAYVGGRPERVDRIVLKTFRDLRIMAGLTNQEVMQEINDRLGSFRYALRTINISDCLPSGTPPTAALIRKVRIADDLDWRCPYTGRVFTVEDIISGRVVTDHIIPRAQRPSDSLDSLALTFPAVKAMKGDRTAWRFVREEQGNPVPGAGLITRIMQLKHFDEHIANLDKRGHYNDQFRKRKRIARFYVEGFERRPGFSFAAHLQPSLISRLARQVVLQPFSHLATPPPIIALPGQLSARTRAAWNPLPCLASSTPAVLLPASEGGDGQRLATRTDIRNLTPLIHALNATMHGFTASLCSEEHGIWRALIEGQPTEKERQRLTKLDLGEVRGDGQIFLHDLPEKLKKQLRVRLAENRVVQHISASRRGFMVEENTRGLVSVEGDLVVLRQKKRTQPGKIIVNTRTEHISKVIGLPTPGSENGKLARQKGVRVIANNFGVAVLDNDKLPFNERLVMVPHVRVWHQLEALRERNGGRMPAIWRNGHIIEIPSQGRWRICSVKNNLQKGIVLDLGSVAEIRASWLEVRLRSLLRDGAQLLHLALTGSPRDKLKSDSKTPPPV